MLEDVLGWAVVLAGAVIMRFTGLAVLDPILSAGVALFIAVHALRNLREGLWILPEKVPCGMDADSIREQISGVDGVLDVHHIHLWTMDGQSHYAAMHIVTDADPHLVKECVRGKLKERGVVCAILELETGTEPCHVRRCHVEHADDFRHHHRHNHHERSACKKQAPQ